MLFLLTQQVLNGTVTMSVISTGVEAIDFASAKKKVLFMPGFEINPHTVDTDTDTELSFTFPGYYVTWGRMENKPLEVI